MSQLWLNSLCYFVTSPSFLISTVTKHYQVRIWKLGICRSVIAGTNITLSIAPVLCHYADSILLVPPYGHQP